MTQASPRMTDAATRVASSAARSPTSPSVRASAVMAAPRDVSPGPADPTGQGPGAGSGLGGGGRARGLAQHPELAESRQGHGEGDENKDRPGEGLGQKASGHDESGEPGQNGLGDRIDFRVEFESGPLGRVELIEYLHGTPNDHDHHGHVEPQPDRPGL